MSQRLVVIAEYRDLPQAGLAQSTLEAKGIQCYRADQYRVGIDWLFSTAPDRIKLKVPECDAVRANEILCRFEHILTEGSGMELASEEICSHCGSIGNINKNTTGKFAAVSLLLSLPLFFFVKRKNCVECGHKWK